MGRKLKTLLIALGVIMAVMWHHQATIFQRQVRENLNLLQAYAGPSLQLGDIIISKYLFKVEFKKPQLEIDVQSLEKIKEDLPKDASFLSKLLQKQIDNLSPTFHLNYRSADRLVLSYNPFWHELSLTPVGDKELSIHTEKGKIDLLAPEHTDLNQGKIRISLPAPSSWIHKIRTFFFKGGDDIVKITLSYRNFKIVNACNQETIYTRDYCLIKINVNEEWVEGKQYYTLDLDLESDNACFGPALAKIWPSLEFYVLGGKTDRRRTYKIRVDSEEGKAFMDAFMSELEESGEGGEVDWKSLLRIIPTLKIDGKDHYHNSALSYATDYHVDYQPHKNYLKAACDSTFQAYSPWPAYLEKLCAFYREIVTYPQGQSKTTSEPVIPSLRYPWLANLKDAGEIKFGFMLELKDMNSDEFQAQGSLKLGLEKTGMGVRGDYKAPGLLNMEIDFEDPETFFNKIYSYTLNSLRGASQKVAELMLPGLKTTLIENIKKLSVSTKEAQPHACTIPVQFNGVTQTLEIAGKPVHHEFLDIVKMIISLGNQDLLDHLTRCWGPS